MTPADKIKNAFAKAALSYDDNASLQRQVAVDLLRRFDITADCGRLLDLGCGTGFVAQQLCGKSYGGRVLALDIAENMLQAAKAKLQHLPVNYLCANASKLPIATASVDKIVSNLALQWCCDLPAAIADCRRVLVPDGGLFFATFGAQTLVELKQAWAAVDDEMHVNEFYQSDTIGGFLHLAKLQNIQIASKIYTVTYPSVLALMHTLKGIGANQLFANNRRNTNKSQLQKMIATYQKLGNGIITATYEVIFVAATK